MQRLGSREMGGMLTEESTSLVFPNDAVVPHRQVIAPAGVLAPWHIDLTAHDLAHEGLSERTGGTRRSVLGAKGDNKQITQQKVP